MRHGTHAPRGWYFRRGGVLPFTHGQELDRLSRRGAPHPTAVRLAIHSRACEAVERGCSRRSARRGGLQGRPRRTARQLPLHNSYESRLGWGWLWSPIALWFWPSQLPPFLVRRCSIIGSSPLSERDERSLKASFEWLETT